MHQFSTFETGLIIKSVNTATRDVDWLLFEIYYDVQTVVRMRRTSVGI